MAQRYQFGTGIMSTERTDIANTTPAIFGVLQEVTVDFSFTNKQLRGAFQSPVDNARADLAISAKAKFARINAATFNNSFFGQTLTQASGIAEAINEAGTPATGTFTVANAATYVSDEGVLIAATGVQLDRVASAPATGQYSVVETTGVYTFPSGFVTPCLFNYKYGSTTMRMISGTNQLQGSGPSFRCSLSNQFKGGVMNLVLYAGMASKLSLPMKNSDWVIPEMDMDFFADPSGKIFDLTTVE